MSKSKRFTLLLALAVALARAGAVRAQEHGNTGAGATGNAPAAHTDNVAAEVGHAASPAAEHGGNEHGSHIEGDERLVPIPPSRDTLVAALWTIIIFVVMLAILYPTAWKNILIGLKKREERIRKDIADAEAARNRAEATLREYNQQLATAEGRVRDMLAKATADAERLATSMRMQAQQESEEIKERATRDIEAARAQAIRDIQAQAADLATTIAAKIIKRNLNAADQQDLVRESLDQLQTVR